MATVPSDLLQRIRDLGIGVSRFTSADGAIDLRFTDGGAVRIRPDSGRLAISEQGEGAGEFFRALGHQLLSGPRVGQLLTFDPGNLDSLFPKQPGTSPSSAGSSSVPDTTNLQTAIDTAQPRLGATRARNPLIRTLQQAQTQSVQNQQSTLQQFGALGRESILNASPELRQLSDTLLQQARDPGGGGFREDFQERVRVQQAAAGLSGGSQAAYQEAALTSGALQQRRLQAGQRLQSLGGTFLQRLGLGSPIAADLAGIGNTELATQTLAAVTAANQAQSQISQDIFNQISGFLNQRETERTRQRTLFGGGSFGGQVIPPGVSVTTG